MPLAVLIECLSISDKFDTVGATVEPNNPLILGSLPGRNRLFIPNVARDHAVIWVQDTVLCICPLDGAVSLSGMVVPPEGCEIASSGFVLTLQTSNFEMKGLLKCESTDGPSRSPSPFLTTSKKRERTAGGYGDDEAPLKKKRGNGH